MTTLLTIPEVAAQLRVSERFVWRLLAERWLPRTKIGNVTRIQQAAIDRYIKQRTKKQRTG
jgi:excisionase family DNA binding protein